MVDRILIFPEKIQKSMKLLFLLLLVHCHYYYAAVIVVVVVAVAVVILGGVFCVSALLLQSSCSF